MTPGQRGCAGCRGEGVEACPHCSPIPGDIRLRAAAKALTDKRYPPGPRPATTDDALADADVVLAGAEEAEPSVPRRIAEDWARRVRRTEDALTLARCLADAVEKNAPASFVRACLENFREIDKRPR